MFINCLQNTTTKICEICLNSVTYIMLPQTPRCRGPHGSGGGPKEENNTIVYGFLRAVFRSSDRRRCSVHL